MKVLFIITSSKSATWLSEVTHPYWHFAERGIDVDFSSPQGGKILWHPWSDPYSDSSQEPDDLVSKGFLSDPALLARLDNTLELGTLDLSQYDAVHVAGGGGAAVDLFPNEAVGVALEHFWANEKIVGAICHGAISLANLPARLKGRHVTGFSLAEDQVIESILGKDFIPNFPQPTLEAAGAEYSCANHYEVHVVVDDKLITGQNQQSASEYALTIIHALSGRSPVTIAA
jgi:putative intracellular protease/amidase